MKDFTLPTPDDVEYGRNYVLEAALRRIRQCITDRRFEFQPEVSWNFQMDNINAEIGKFGWKIETKWEGTNRDNAYTIWVLVPTSNTFDLRSIK